MADWIMGTDNSNGKDLTACCFVGEDADNLIEAQKCGISTKRILELCRAEQDGRCVVLPCKVGDTVWAYSEFGNQVVPYTVEFIGISDLAIQFDCNWYSYSECMEDANFELSDFGKIVFLTREEAEAALKEGKV